MSSYWLCFPDFEHDPFVPLRQEFERLAREEGWGKKSRMFKDQWGLCGIQEFGYQFGKDENRLAGWQALCATVGVKKTPDSIAKCKTIMRNTWVNIYDLLDAKRTGKTVLKHPSKDALRSYSINSKPPKIFSKAQAKKNRFLKILLIEMFMANY
ncbi:unnamed protein product [Mycena citricolor]|uniref:Uncharacterized protein n=1 Tax=Mycena citricolor TaxID=2018698 RepID=A0AAD2GW38_9AGAR|nr:unnamed protein product [Mycena citricolor]